MNILPFLLLNPFSGNRRQILTDLHSHYFSLGSDGLG
jgi:hypothetical protein